MKRDPTDTAHDFTHAQHGTPLDEIVRIAGHRWTIEECFEQAKQLTGPRDPADRFRSPHLTGGTAAQKRRDTGHRAVIHTLAPPPSTHRETLPRQGPWHTLAISGTVVLEKISQLRIG